MKLKNIYLSLILVALSVALFQNFADAQVANINVGNYQIEWNNNAQYVGGGYSSSNFTGVWPGGWYKRGTIGWYGVGCAFEKLIQFRNLKDASEGADTLMEGVEYAPEVDGPVVPLKEYRKQYPPSVIVDGKPAKPYAGLVDKNLPAAMMVQTVTKTGWGRGGSWFKINVYAFDNPAYSDFIILDYTMIQKMNFTKENNNVNGPTDQTIKQWFSPIFLFNPTQYGFEQYGKSFYESGTWNDYVAVPSSLVPAGTSSRDSLIISYSCDGNYKPSSYPGNMGDPLPGSGELVSTPYVGMATLYADKSTKEHVDDITQPSNVITGHIEDLWNWEAEGSLFSWTTTPGRLKNPNGTAVDITPDIPYTELSRMSYQWVGPYDMTYNDSVHFVVAVAAGGIDPVKALEIGKQWKAGLITTEQKDSLIQTGLDSLIATMDKAKWAWNNFQKTGDFGIPWPLPAPEAKVTSGPGWNTVNWSYADASMFKNRRTGVEDFKEWRVYQKRGDYQVNHPNDKAFYDYHLVYSTTDKNVNSYNDTAVVRGESYHYFVVAVNKEGIESSRYLNRTLYAASPFKPGSQNSEKVMIVPNPYIANAGALNFSNPNDIKFFNLPPYCKLRIYNEVGDIIKTLDHTSGSGDETWNQLSSSNQYVTSGIYILSVQDAKDLNGNGLPNKNYKFAIVR